MASSISPLVVVVVGLFAIFLPSSFSLNLRPLSSPFLTSGKELAVAGEKLIDMCRVPPLDNYGGSLSQAGASLRNAGDALGQVGADVRNKFASEQASDSLRTTGECIIEAADYLASFAENEMEGTGLQMKQDVANVLRAGGEEFEVIGRVVGGISMR